MRVISFYSSKGGCGKTASASMLGYILAEQGKSVLMIDLCQNGDLANNLKYDRTQFEATSYDWLIGEKTIGQVVVKERENLLFIPSNKSLNDLEKHFVREGTMMWEMVLKNKLESFKDTFDYVLLDCHPKAEEASTRMAIIASDLVVVPFKADGNDLFGALRSAEMVVKNQTMLPNLDYLLVPTMFNNMQRFKQNKILKQAKKEFNDNGLTNYYDDKIRMTTTFADLTSTEKTFSELKKDKYFRKLIEDYEKLLETINHVLNKKQEVVL